MIADRYDLQSLLGTGGTAEVWRAHDLRLDRVVAVKVLHRRGRLADTATERFEREIRAVARLSHPNIVSVYDAGSEGGDPYLVMELLDGVSVADLIADRPLPVSDAVAIAAQVCAGLSAAHAAGVVHRDVKPGNVVRTRTGVVKVLDFGIATLAETTGGTLTETATVVGTGDYLAPERISSSTADARSDLYSLGCLLYAMLTGSPPFRGDPMSVLYQHVHTEPQDVRDLRHDVPHGLAQLVAELLAKDPADRPASAADVARRLQDASTTDTLVLPQPPATPPRRKRPWIVAAAALVAAAVLALLLLDLPRGPDQADHATDPTTAASSPSDPPQTSPESAAPSETDEDTSPAGRLAQARATLDRHIRTGGVDADAAKKLQDDLAKIEDKHLDGKPEDAAKHVADMRKRLDDLAREGKVQPTAYRALKTSTRQLAESLPPPEQDERGEDDDEGEDD